MARSGSLAVALSGTAAAPACGNEYVPLSGVILGILVLLDDEMVKDLAVVGAVVVAAVAEDKEILAAKVKEIADDKVYLDALERDTAVTSKGVSRGFLQMGVSAALEELECALEGWFPVASANVTAEGGADLWSNTIRRPGLPYPCI